MELTRLLDAATAADFKTDTERDEAAEAAHRFLERVESPWRRCWDLAMDHPAYVASLKVCLDLDLFTKWHESGNPKMTYKELEQLVQVPPEALRRYLRHLASHGVVNEVKAETYVQTAMSNALMDPTVRGWVDWLHTPPGSIPPIVPQYLRERNYEPPTEARSTAFQYRNNSPKTVFEYLQENPDVAKVFNQNMTGYTASRPPWTDVYPTETLLDSKADVILVDVGGNVGKDLDRFRSKHPGTGPQLVLQDLGHVVRSADCSSDIVRMGHDFFNEQPVKGAKAYYFHSIIHNWSDSNSEKILRQIRNAMTPGYSKILINDMILPSFKAPRLHTGLDVMEMVGLAACERTREMWSDLLERVDPKLKIIKFHEEERSATGIVEVELTA